MEKELNLIPFYAEALSFPQNIRRDIDTTYLLHKEEYYQCAKNSEFYDCAFAKDKSLLTEEYYKKSLGFLVYVEKMQDDETAECIFKLFKKAYRKTYLFFKDKDPEEIDMEDYIRYMSSYLTQLDDDSFNGHTMAAIFFSGGHCKNMQTLWEVLDLRWRYVNGFKRISSSNVTPEMDVECKKLEKEIAANIFDKILLSNEETTGFDFIYDLEGLSSLSLFRELEFKRSDIKELVLSYLAADEIKKQNLSFNAYLLPAMHLKGMCKAYNKVKEMYFQNNKETMYVEVSALKKDLLRARSDLKMQENRNEQLLNIQNEKVESLLSENVQLEKQIKKLQEQINQIQAESKEIVALRNYIFKQEEIEQTDENVDINTIKLDKINEVKGMIVGGHINWQNKLREMIPSWRIIKAGVNTLDENIILNSNIVVFNTAHLNHSLYYRIIDVIRNTDVKIGYISSTNIENALKEILELLV